MNRWHLLSIVVLVGAINIAISIFYQTEYNLRYFTFASLNASILAGILLIFDKWLWRLAPLHPWFVAAPDINGDWKVLGNIAFGPGDNLKSYRGKMTIKQTFFAIQADMDWDDGSKTHFLTKSQLSVNEGGFCAFSALYEYMPAPGAGLHNATHRSGFFFYAPEQRPANITVHYSTSDHQIGQLILTRKKSG